MSDDNPSAPPSDDESEKSKERKKKKKKVVIIPHINDIVSGRGSGSNRHEGNLHFRKLIRENKQLYLSRCKNEKMSVARDIFDSISSLDPPGRFLQKNPETGTWFEIGKDRALEKISQALREKNSKQPQVQMVQQQIQQQPLQPLQPPTLPMGHIDQAHHRHFGSYTQGSYSPTRLVGTGSDFYNDRMLPGQQRTQQSTHMSERMAYLARELRQADERLSNHDDTSLHTHQMLSREAEIRRQRNQAQQNLHQQQQQQQQQRNMFMGSNLEYSGLQREHNVPPVVPKPAWYYDTLSIPSVPEVPRFQRQAQPLPNLPPHQMHPPLNAQLLEREQLHASRQRYLIDSFGRNMPTAATNINLASMTMGAGGNPFASFSTPSQQRAPPNIPFVTPEQLMNASAQHQRFNTPLQYQNDGLAIVDNSSPPLQVLDDGQDRSRKKKKKKKKRLRSDEEESSQQQTEASSKRVKKTDGVNSPLESKGSMDSLDESSIQGTNKEQDAQEQPRDVCNVRDSNNEWGQAKSSSDEGEAAEDSDAGRDTQGLFSREGLEALSQAASLFRR